MKIETPKEMTMIAEYLKNYPQLRYLEVIECSSFMSGINNCKSFHLHPESRL